jgi:simple sugar transport system permease protein
MPGGAPRRRQAHHAPRLCRQRRGVGAGIIIAARLGSGSSNAGGGFELEVIAAVVLGGTSLFGRGTMVGTMLGALTVAVIGNGLILAHLSPFLTPIVTGIIILVAIWLNFRLFNAGRQTG